LLHFQLVEEVLAKKILEIEEEVRHYIVELPN
jgi:hypothetical protein